MVKSKTITIKLHIVLSIFLKRQDKKNILNLKFFIILYQKLTHYSSLRNIPVASDAIDDYDKKTYHFGPNIGYGYNWVPFKKVLVAGAITLGVNGAIEENLLTRKTVFIVNPSVIGRFSIGYIGENWIVSASTLSNGLYLNFKETYQSSLLTSTFSFTVIKRFKLKKEIPFLQKDYDWKEAIFGKKNNELVSDIE